MKRTISVMAALLLSAAAIVPAANGAIVVSVGDRPYYNHGPYYYRGPIRYVWIPGHTAWRHHHHVWVHGHYAPRTW
jgi:hypothetical protein